MSGATIDSATMPSMPPTSAARHDEQGAAARPAEHGARARRSSRPRAGRRAADSRRRVLGRAAADDEPLEPHGDSGAARRRQAAWRARRARRDTPRDGGTRCARPAPRAAAASSSGTLLAPERVEILVDTGRRKQRWWRPSPRRARNRATPVSGARRLEQLDLAVARGEQRRPHALIRQLGLADDGQAEGVAPEPVRAQTSLTTMPT